MTNAAAASIATSGARTFRRWFFPGMAILMLVTSIAGFAPAILNPIGRRGPLSLLGAAHGIVFFAWIVLFLVQALLVESRRVAWHRRLGLASISVFVVLVSLGYAVTIGMVRRGYDLSGDQGVGQGLDAPSASIFNFGDLFTFTLLVVGAIWFRGRPGVHKRLMLFANIHLMGAPITHFLGHNGLLTPITVTGGIFLFVLAAVLGDYLLEKRVHPLTAGLAFLSIAMLPIEGALIGPSSGWHYLVRRIAQGA
jgi:hypothetical protein